MKKLLLVFSVVAAVFTCFASMPSISTAFQAQPGELYSVTLDSTLQGMKDALNGEFGTGIFAKDDQIIFMWRMLNGWAFVGLNSSSKDMEETLLNLRANFSSLKDYSGIISALGKAGWTSISYQVIEGSVRNPVVMATINKILGCAADRLTTLVLLPMLTDPNQIGAVKYERINPALSQQ